MTRRLASLVLSGCFALLLARTATAAETHTGLIAAVGPNHKIMIVNEQDDRQTFDIAADATIMLDDKPATLDDLQPMQRVTIVTQRDGSKFIAQIIKAYTNVP
jgi:hypothetical protein